MKTAQKLVAMLMVFAMVLSIAACKKKTKKISAEEFRTKLEAASYDVYGDEVPPSDNVNSFLIAVNKNILYFMISHLTYLSKADAKKSFDDMKNTMQVGKEEGKITNLTISDNKIVAEESTSYTVLILADEVLIMASGSDSTAVNDALKILGL
ncbi:MAG: hypothetical protein IKM88_15560 [Lachnospiraceae bacterium]|nr:hypothetical protein [Clostridiales bacterium]MBR6851639.1 hypothetical protein [Lachnospiraceae bacterium]